MSDSADAGPFRITLLQNGVHSLERGFQRFDEYLRLDDDFLLKEAIMFIHHGIELLLKQLLAQANEFLIFSDLRQVVRKQRQAKQQGMHLLDLDDPPHTATYLEAIERVDAFLDVPDFDARLQRALRELNRWRNMLEHYAIEADRDAILSILADIRGPLLAVFKAHIPDFEMEARTLIESLEKYELIAAYIRAEAKGKGGALSSSKGGKGGQRKRKR